jgi:translation initiation factor IF-3
LKFRSSGRGKRPRVRINGQIRAKAVRTVDKDGKQVGILEISKAISLARASKLDLVEVAPHLDPPVCRILDFGKYQYLQMKKTRLAKKKQVGGKLKEIKIRPRIETHDYEVKLRHAREFLSKGYKLRIRLVYRGRELSHRELGDSLLVRIEKDLKDVGNVEMPPRRFGRNVLMVFGPARSGSPGDQKSQRKDDRDAKTEDEPSGGKKVQDNENGKSEEAPT